MQSELEEYSRIWADFGNIRILFAEANAKLAASLNSSRKARGLSHVQLGEKAGIDAELVRKLLNNAQKMKPMDARKLVKALTK